MLYGDRTMLTEPSAFDRINVRRLFIVLEKAIAKAAKYQLFEFNDEDLSNKIENTITTSLQKWLPFVSVEDIKIEQTNELKDSNTVNVEIKFRIGDNINLDTLTFNVQA